MIEYILWVISFASLYISFVWLFFLYLDVFRPNAILNRYPDITVAIPAHNEEDTIYKTVDSVLCLDYPADKLSVVVVDDASADNTSGVVRKYLASHPGCRVKLIIKRINEGKAAALNTALEQVHTELFACVDADSYVEPVSLKPMLLHFAESEKTAAVISAIKVNNPKNIYEKIQRLEYILGILARRLRASINTLSVTPGVLSVYRTDVIKDIGGFDRDNITEDFEIAMRLKYYGFNVKIETQSVTYTNVPSTFKTLWRQRLRWYRGYIYNHVKYREMFFSRRHKLMGCFEMPLGIISVLLLFSTLIVVSYGSIANIYETAVRSTLIDGYLKNLFAIPTFREFVLTHNFKVMFPIYISSLAGLYMFYIAHKQLKEKFKYPFSIWAYFVVFPYFSFMHWMFSIFEEVMKVKKKW